MFEALFPLKQNKNRFGRHLSDFLFLILAANGNFFHIWRRKFKKRWKFRPKHGKGTVKKTNKPQTSSQNFLAHWNRKRQVFEPLSERVVSKKIEFIRHCPVHKKGSQKCNACFVSTRCFLFGRPKIENGSQYNGCHKETNFGWTAYANSGNNYSQISIGKKITSIYFFSLQRCRQSELTLPNSFHAIENWPGKTQPIFLG